jgi:hypothetical protein
LVKEMTPCFQSPWSADGVSETGLSVLPGVLGLLGVLELEPHPQPREIQHTDARTDIQRAEREVMVFFLRSRMNRQVNAQVPPVMPQSLAGSEKPCDRMFKKIQSTRGRTVSRGQGAE